MSEILCIDNTMWTVYFIVSTKLQNNVWQSEEKLQLMSRGVFEEAKLNSTSRYVPLHGPKKESNRELKCVQL